VRVLPALVLAAGLGTRLDPLTRLVAKASVPLAGKTLLERSLEHLRQQGVTDVVINLHHKPDTVTAILGDGTRLGMRIRYSWEPRILGSAGGPRRALPLLDAGRFLIVNGDTLCDVNLGDMVRDHVDGRADVTMAVVPNPAPDHYNGIGLDADRRVTSFVPRGQAQGSWHFIGVQVAEARVFAELSDGEPAETVAGIYRERIATGTMALRGYCIDLPFVDVGTPRDYLAAAVALAGTGDGNAIEAGARIEPSTRMSGTVVWSNSSVGSDCVLDDCVVADVSLPAGFRASSAVLVPSPITKPGDAATIIGDVAVFPLKR
jgi:NDP-sugar pyrophosphorylase family protein